MATVVLVAGAWCGGCIWEPVAARLRAAGHATFTPTLTGPGERVHLAHPGIDLDGFGRHGDESHPRGA